MWVCLLFDCSFVLFGDCLGVCVFVLVFILLVLSFGYLLCNLLVWYLLFCFVDLCVTVDVRVFVVRLFV